MQELLLWVDTEAEQGRREWRDGFDWRKFHEQIERKCGVSLCGRDDF
jgi:hypothetical protein